MNKPRSSHRLFMVPVVHLIRVHIAKALFQPLWLIALAGVLLLAGCDKGPSSDDKGPGDGAPHDGPPTAPKDKGGGGGPGDCPDDTDHSPPRPSTGAYNVLIRGDYQGVGTASVSGDSVSISAQVTNAAGEKGTFSFSGPLVNKRFTGSGNVMGNAASVFGRVDSPDAGGKGSILTSMRLVGTVYTSTGRVARIAGQP